jgi:DMSO/TMAO reductase YedYZ molybdopterin-dependent catalytic subunit
MCPCYKEVDYNLRITTSQQNLMSRSQFLRPRRRFPVNRIPTNVITALNDALPYAGRAGFTPTVSFYTPPTDKPIHVDVAAWQLSIQGLVHNYSSFALDDIRNMQAFEMPCTLANIASTPNNLLMGHALWKGVSFKRLLDEVGFRAEAQYAQFRSANGYSTYLPIKMLDKAILAYEMNGETLSAEQGYPVRLIVPGVYDYKMPKWLQSVEMVAAPSSGHYEARGWSAEGRVQTTSAIFSPRLREVVDGKVTFSGMAFAGTRTITQIELSIDDGDWMPVPFVTPQVGSWTRWQIDWQPSAPGDYLVKVRATDSDGFIQTNTSTPAIFPNGSSAIHAVVFRVSM